MWEKCDVKNQDEETAVPGVNICDVKNEMSQMKWGVKSEGWKWCEEQSKQMKWQMKDLSLVWESDEKMSQTKWIGVKMSEMIWGIWKWVKWVKWTRMKYDVM